MREWHPKGHSSLFCGKTEAERWQGSSKKLLREPSISVGCSLASSAGKKLWGFEDRGMFPLQLQPLNEWWRLCFYHCPARGHSVFWLEKTLEQVFCKTIFPELSIFPVPPSSELSQIPRQQLEKMLSAGSEAPWRQEDNTAAGSRGENQTKSCKQHFLDVSSVSQGSSGAAEKHITPACQPLY